MNAQTFIDAQADQHLELEGKDGADVLTLCGFDTVERLRVWPRIRGRCQYLIERNADGAHPEHMAASAAYMDGLLLGLRLARQGDDA